MTTAIIPSRYGSSRFPGKPLAMIAGKPLVQRAYEQAAQAKSIDRVVIATDDQRIADVVTGFGGDVIMTNEELRTGTDRIASVANMLGLADDEIVINIQGDQPMFDPSLLDSLVSPFEQEPELLSSTLAYKIIETRQITDPSDVKVVFDRNGYAMYFSRAQIPFPRDGQQNVDYYKHLGFYAFKKSMLDTFASLATSTYEDVEKLEQLRLLDFGYKMKVVTCEFDSPSIDLPGDIEYVEKKLAQQG
jgi:3-deoxy-manno-octulosonate cytidylyltransferase (CMP-KDO synthetase)